MALPAIPAGLAAMISRILARGAQTGTRGGASSRLMEPSVGQMARTMSPATAATTVAAGAPSIYGGLPSRGAFSGDVSTMEGFMPSGQTPEERGQPMSPEDMAQINAAKRFPTSDDNAMTYRARQEFDDAVRYRELVDSGRLDRANFEDENAVPNPGRTITPVERRALAASTRTPPAQRSAPSVSSLWDRYNESGNAADFILADRAMREAGVTGTGEPMPKKAGGAVSGSDVALQQALEIIHRLLAERRQQ
jgi:hypothetical protein